MPAKKPVTRTSSSAGHRSRATTAHCGRQPGIVAKAAGRVESSAGKTPTKKTATAKDRRRKRHRRKSSAEPEGGEQGAPPPRAAAKKARAGKEGTCAKPRRQRRPPRKKAPAEEGGDDESSAGREEDATSAAAKKPPAKKTAPAEEDSPATKEHPAKNSPPKDDTREEEAHLRPRRCREPAAPGHSKAPPLPRTTSNHPWTAKELATVRAELERERRAAEHELSGSRGRDRRSDQGQR